MAWVLLLGLMFLWTGYKQKQGLAEHNKKVEQQKADSLANVASKPKPTPAADSAARAALAASGGAQLGATRDSSDTVALAASMAPGADSAAATVQAPAAAPALERRIITVETNLFTFTLDNEGAKIGSVILKDLAGHTPKNAAIIPETGGALTLTVDNQDMSKVLWETNARESSVKVGSQPVTITFKAAMPGGQKTLTRSYTFFGDSTRVAHNLEASAPMG